MLTTLSGRETKLIFAIMQDMTAIQDARQLRLQLGAHLLDLLEADYFASFVWTRTEGDTDAVFLNMDERNLAAYQHHFQHCDPITPRFRMCRRATHLDQIISREDFLRTEFYNDFLARDGLHQGMNFHAYAATGHLGDLRIWRGAGKDTFQQRDLDILNAIGTAFGQALANMRTNEQKQREADPRLRLAAWAARHQLTGREQDVLCLVSEGKRDREIALDLNISVTTVRSHLKAVFQKSGVTSRAELLASINARLSLQ
ncbi:transcriptional regulator, LuxR family protein [Roseibium aggregatum IAM 12614]|uniref:Transcriptional regulator, LuxR family protein n=1 Tax=Roseibium aggregatum (strain ATCC 25650 / DSM 13394 / JCM 20685 / NBRC 16684 / NCIMB 2208 / IAM 12614 / B1) TaxID=384765 RepID=A0NZ23_ROSAI|nr:LuxR family transcriptional regulator [Roseibium aggregatum]EAV42024.1 transcriptional regulator, LuxR family protein [Roseibium aggregatum IAM 12614]